jgi:DNA-binding GntR family transcriptional regulator
MALRGSERVLRRDEPIARRSLHDEVVERIRDLIIEGELAPGARVPERLLCERFGISRTPLREALKVLAAEGLVQLLPNRGARVVALSAATVAEHFEVLAGLEALAGELACRRIGKRELVPIRRAHDAMVKSFAKADLSSYFKLNQEIHQRIVDAAGNATLKDLHEALAGRVKRARFMANLSEERWRQAVLEHEAIIEALEARDADGLARILKQHLRNKAEAVMQAMLDTAGEKAPGEKAAE